MEKINGVHWFSRLKGGLLHSTSEARNRLTVCRTFEGYRKFAKFEHAADFIEFARKDNPAASFAEVMFGEYPSKMHFDIDISRSEADPIAFENGLGLNVVEALVIALNRVLNRLQEGFELVPGRDLALFTSHGSEKLSFHLITVRHQVQNMEQKRQLAKMVIGEMPVELGKWVDPGVYSKIQQLRILGSPKPDTRRYKEYEPNWSVQGRPAAPLQLEEAGNFVYRLRLKRKDVDASLSLFRLSLCTEPCSNFLPNIPIPPKKQYTTLTDLLDFAEDDWQRFEAAVGKALGLESLSDCYSIGKVQDGIVCLLRNAPHHCPLCKRVHENENPYLIVSRDPLSLILSVRWHCRRSEAAPLLIVPFFSVEYTPPQILAGIASDIADSPTKQECTYLSVLSPREMLSGKKIPQKEQYLSILSTSAPSNNRGGRESSQKTHFQDDAYLPCITPF